MSQPEHAYLHLPNPALGSSIFLGVERDTRKLCLTEAQRFNYYPATPFPMISWIFSGDLHMVLNADSSALPALSPRLPRIVFSGPHRHPTASWSPDAVHALSVSFYPEFISKVFGLKIDAFFDQIVPLESVAPLALWQSCAKVMECADAQPFTHLQHHLRAFCNRDGLAMASPTMAAWLKSLAVRATFTKTGTGIRQFQRHMKNWTGQSHRDLQLYARTEEVLMQASHVIPPTLPDLARLAADAGFADQSHLGREIRRVTGLSPKKLEMLIRTEESFWLYRLLQGYHRASHS